MCNIFYVTWWIFKLYVSIYIQYMFSISDVTWWMFNYMSPFIYSICSLFCVFAGSKWLPNSSCALECSRKQK